MIKNFEHACDEVRKFLPEYLRSHSIDPKSFSCLNTSAHTNDDKNKSAGIVPASEGRNWYCFTECKSGDIFTACHYLEGLPIEGPGFLTTLSYLANKYSVPIDHDQISEDDKETRKMVAAYKRSLHNLIATNDKKIVEKFKKERAWSTGTLPLYCCSSYDKYRKRMLTEYSMDFLNSIGLLDRNLFTNERVLFPIYDHRKQLVAYAGRIVSGESSNKYYNTISYKNYDKSSLLYNFCNCTSRQPLYVAEGYADCISASINGYPNTVALGSTALSRKHIHAVLNRNFEKIVLLFDQDEHGQKATERSLDMLEEFDLSVSVATLPFGKDPDEYFRIVPQGKFNQHSIFEWNVYRMVSTHSPEEVVSRFIPALIEEKNDNAVLFRKNIKHLADMSGVSEKDISFTIENIMNGTKKDKVSQIKKELKKIISQHHKPEFLIPALKEKIKSCEGQIQSAPDDPFTGWKEDVVEFDRIAQKAQLLLGFETGFDQLTDKLDGWQKGCWYCFGGDSNILKTGFLVELSLRAAKLNDVVVVFLSLDDSKKILIPRIIANLGGLSINNARKPGILEPKERELYNKGFTELQNMKNYIVFDSKEIKGIEQAEKTIVNIKEKYCKDLIVFWDSHHTNAGNGTDMRASHVKLANKVKELVVEYDLVMISSIEFTKRNDRRKKPTINDIREAVDIEYRASVVGIMHNEFHAKGERRSNVYWEDEYGSKREIIEVTIAKNKTSSFKGMIPYKAIKEQNRFIEYKEYEMNNFYELYDRR
jgi:DNA primase catalytic core